MYYVNKVLPEKNVQERVERSRLRDELILIEKQQKSELKMYESEVQKIRSKYSKTRVCSDSFSEAAGVKMYETHNPGFCYKRNGAHKIPPSISSIPVLDFQLQESSVKIFCKVKDSPCIGILNSNLQIFIPTPHFSKQLRSLLFTNNELDVAKLLCLHMLSVHTTESLTMPNLKLLKDITKENTPMERLIRRSKKINRQKNEHHEILNLLPIYVIDIAQGQSTTTINTILKEDTEDQLFRDARITSRLIVNNKIQEILVSVLTALKSSKSEKLIHLLQNCQNPTFLKKIFNRLSMQEFLKMLKTYSLITSCESYTLTPKIKHQPNHIEIRTVFGHLEALILQIRKYILQIPSKTKNEWKSLYDLDEEMLQDLMTCSTSQNLAVFEASTNRKKSSRSVMSSARIRKSEVMEKSVSYLGRKSHRNFVTRNTLPFQGETGTRKVVDSEDRKPKKFLNTSVSKRLIPILHELPSIASGHEAETKSIDVFKTQENKFEENEEQFVKSTLPESASIIKKSSCCACQEKWKLSLPFPKIPNYKRPGLPLQIYEDPYKIGHLNRISSMISQELYNLESYDTRYIVENAYTRIKSSQYSAPPTAPENKVSPVADTLEISPYDLARVSHEIADKETNKKLTQFLKESF